MAVILETTMGDITVDLHTNERPRACLNFLKLCKTKYYNYCLFHKVEHNFTAQTGDPEGTGRGGESIFSKLYGEQAKFFEAEVKPRIKHREVGTVSMINNGQNMHGSQFFITLGEELDYLDGEHTVFGQVSEGLETLTKINDCICDTDHKPYQDIRITHTVILDDPFDDPPGLQVPDSSPELTAEQLKSSGRIGADEEIDDTKGKSLDEIEEEIQDKEAKARATILEMVGDIPEVDVAPPDNVLFVCKLNPVTTADDLEVIFSRFGEIASCEVIKDKKSGESLQYAFIEFKKPGDCENAYFKMDNVLIDDRRIHVDFSQSVSKLNQEELQQHAKRPKFQVKERMAAQRKDKYDMVFEDDKPQHQTTYQDIKKEIKEEEKKHKSRKKKDRSRSRDTRSSEHSRKHSKKEHRRKRSPSSSSGSSSRSGSSDHKSRKRYKRSRSPDRRGRRRRHSREDYPRPRIIDHRTGRPHWMRKNAPKRPPSMDRRRSRDRYSDRHSRR